MKRNDFTTNQQCRAFLIKLFDIFHIKYEFKASSILVWYSDREHYRVILDPEKVLVKLINKRTGAVKEYWKPEPYYARSGGWSDLWSDLKLNFYL